MNQEILATLVGPLHAGKLLAASTIEGIMLMEEKEIAYITTKKSAQIIEAAKKMSRSYISSEKKAIRGSDDVYKLEEVFEMQFLDHEQFRVVFLRANSTVIKTETISTGGYTGVMVDSRQIWKKALQLNAIRIVLVHNHPSGNPEPSQADNSLTEKIKEQGLIMDIPVLDHLIVCSALGTKPYYSYMDSGRL